MDSVSPVTSITGILDNTGLETLRTIHIGVYFYSRVVYVVISSREAEMELEELLKDREYEEGEKRLERALVIAGREWEKVRLSLGECGDIGGFDGSHEFRGTDKRGYSISGSPAWRRPLHYRTVDETKALHGQGETRALGMLVARRD